MLEKLQSCIYIHINCTCRKRAMNGHSFTLERRIVGIKSERFTRYCPLPFSISLRIIYPLRPVKVSKL